MAFGKMNISEAALLLAMIYVLDRSMTIAINNLK